mgnify:CR=1 FL=1
MSRSEELRALGFSLAGRYRAGQFEPASDWKKQQVVYVWTRGADAQEVLRVGIACGRNGFGNRYASYNRWLAGRFKPDNAMEQKKSQLFRQKLDDTCVVWARCVGDKPSALREEAELRARLGPVLELDLMTPGWAKRELAAWRAGGGLPVARAQRHMPSKAPGAPMTHPKELAISPSLSAVFSDLDTGLSALGLDRTAVRDGWQYKAGGKQVCRIDPKNTKGCLRVWVGDEDEQGAPDRLRGQFLQTGWLVVWPEDRTLARDYVLASVRARMRR